MKFLVPAIALFCLAREAVTARSVNTLENAPSRLVDYRVRRHEEPVKSSKRFVRNKSFKQSHHQNSDDFGSLKPKIHDDGHKFSKTRRKSEMENVIQQIESNSTAEVRNRANLTQLLNSEPDLTVLKSLVTETTKVLSKPEDEADLAAKKKRLHPHGRLAGRAKAACDSCGNGYNANIGPTECQSNLENMFICPKCRTHFVVKIHIKESKGCESGWARLKGRGKSQDRRIICFPVNSREKQKKKSTPGRKYVIEFTTRSYEGVSPSTEDGPRVSFVTERRYEVATLPQRAYIGREDSSSQSTFSVSIPQVVDQVTEVRRTGRRRHPGRTLAMNPNDDTCPNSLTPMVACPRCGGHFKISVSITPLVKSTARNRKRHDAKIPDNLERNVQKVGVGVPETVECSMSNLGSMMVCPRCGAVLIVGVHVHVSPEKPWPPSGAPTSNENDLERNLRAPVRPG